MISGFRFPDKPVETSPAVVASLIEQDWICNAKYDGWRVQIYIDGPGHVRFLSRVGRPIDQTNVKMHPIFAQAFELMDLPAGTVIDAEFIGPRGHQDQAIYIFDMLAWDGKWLTQKPYIERWERCQQIKLSSNRIQLAETVENDFIGFFNRLKAAWDGESIHLWEGIVVKARSGKMTLDRNSSKKSKCMMKLKYREIASSRY